MHVLEHEAPKKAANTHEKAPQRRLAFHLDRRAATRCRRAERRPKYDRSRQWAACPIGSRNPTTCGRLSASSTRRPRRSVSREDNLLLFDAGRDRVSRGARQAEPAPTHGRPPSRFASAPPRARTGHPILATCEARDTARADWTGIRPRTHPSGTAACGARLPRAGGEPWLNVIV